jgi:ABC-type taurine transport system ATPase subunit
MTIPKIDGFKPFISFDAPTDKRMRDFLVILWEDTTAAVILVSQVLHNKLLKENSSYYQV